MAVPQLNNDMDANLYIAKTMAEAAATVTATK